ncbi:hypothetical protein [Herbidospora cretacea]|uniref:hypothetical protein n=1 Tax=Herbidospora cretacea TaxID=28444 RepID=UPI0007747E16|nr:hypothetical protein [Herbidospora cretacea]
MFGKRKKKESERPSPALPLRRSGRLAGEPPPEPLADEAEENEEESGSEADVDEDVDEVVVKRPRKQADADLQAIREDGLEVFRSRLRKKHPTARRLVKAWGVKDVGPGKGLQAWYKNVHGISPATTAPELLTAVGDLSEKDDEDVWNAFGVLLGHDDDPTPDKILASTVVGHVMDGDEEVEKEIQGFYEETGRDFGDYDKEFSRHAGLKIFGDPETDRPALSQVRLNTTIEDHTRKQLSVVLGKQEAGAEIDTPEQRQLDRLAWVLANLKASRECVAVVQVMSNDIRLFANRPDARLTRDFQRLFEAATAGAEEAEELINQLFRDMAGQKLEQRIKSGQRIDGAVLKAAERRLRKTLVFLADLDRQWDDLRVLAHTAGKFKVHAETQAADVMLRRRTAELGEEAGESDDDDRGGDKVARALTLKLESGERAKLTRRVTHAKLAIGISKLCCFKCWLMMKALERKGLKLPATGTHLKTYASGWPAPVSLTNPSVLRAYLQINPVPSKRNTREKALADAIADPRKRGAVIKAITDFTAEGQQESGYVSSEDESGIEFDLWDSYYEEPDEADDEAGSDDDEDPQPRKRGRSATPLKLKKKKPKTAKRRKTASSGDDPPARKKRGPGRPRKKKITFEGRGRDRVRRDDSPPPRRRSQKEPRDASPPSRPVPSRARSRTPVQRDQPDGSSGDEEQTRPAPRGTGFGRRKSTGTAKRPAKPKGRPRKK